MIWDLILNAELAEPAIREVHLNFATDQPLRADRKDISHDQHPDHQFRIDRRPTHGRIMRCKFAAEPGKIESSIDLAHHMIFGNCVIEIGRKAALVRSSAVPSSLAPTKIRVSKMERKPLRTSATKSANMRNRTCRSPKRKRRPQAALNSVDQGH